jgi:hypothetical protein
VELAVILKEMKMRAIVSRKLCVLSVVVAVTVLLLSSVDVRAAVYTWTGGTSNAWNLSTNWTGGTFPNAYTDQATIGISTQNPVSLSTTALLGGGGTALTVGTGAAATALDITSSGTLGMQGSLSLRKKITIEGTLRNDAASSATTYTVTGSGGSIGLAGGTISSANGGVWSFGDAVTGYGTISAPIIITASNVSASVANKTLHITGNVTDNLQRGLGGGNTNAASGALLSIEGGTITGVGSGSGITNYNNVDMYGTFINITMYKDGAGIYNLRGDSSWSNGALNDMLFNGHKLDIIGSVTNYGNVNVGTGTLNNPGAGNATITNGNYITLAGGSITSTGGGNFIIGSQITGYGSITAPFTNGSGLIAKGGILSINNGVSSVSTSLAVDNSAGSVLDLKGTIDFGTGGFLVSSTLGEIRLDGATLQGIIGNAGLTYPGAVNVVNDSSLQGTYNSGATLGIVSGKQFNIAAGAALNAYAGSMNNQGTFAIGSGTFNNGSANVYSLGGSGLATLAGGSIIGSGFVSTNTLSGYGSVSAPFTNNGKVIADGAGSPQTLAFSSAASSSAVNTGGMGWFAQNKGKLTLPDINVTAAGLYNWGGDQAAYNLVNSIAINFGAVANPGALSIALLSTDRADVPAGLTNPIGVWSFSSSALAFSSASMTFSYDSALASDLAVDPSTLGLYGYDGTTWNLIPTNPVDTTNRLLTTQSGFDSFYQEYGIAPVPEPATLAIILLGGVGMFIRRRARGV